MKQTNNAYLDNKGIFVDDYVKRKYVSSGNVYTNHTLKELAFSVRNIPAFQQSAYFHLWKEYISVSP